MLGGLLAAHNLYKENCMLDAWFEKVYDGEQYNRYRSSDEKA